MHSVQSNDQIKRLGTSDGIYKVCYIKRIGDTRGQEFYQDLTCVSASPGTCRIR